MATRRTKNSDTERLDPTSIEKAIKLLEEGGTKKDACAILNIAYNTTRLTKLLDKYKDDKAREASKRAEKRGTPATSGEINYIIQAYLEGDTVDSISKTLYRGPTFINSILHKFDVPLRNIPHDYFKPQLVPEGAMRDSFKVGEKVYSMRYDSLAKVDAEWKKGIYRIYLLSDKWREFAYQPAEELASLEHVRTLGVQV
jgi:hypothetical protein